VGPAALTMVYRDMLRCTLPRACCLLLSMWVFACARGPKPGATDKNLPATRIYDNPELGVSFEVPTRWVVAQEGSALVFSGTPDRPSHFTTITIQAQSLAGQSLPDALDKAMAPLKHKPHFAVTAVQPCIIAARPALRYAFEVQLNETLHLRRGALIDTGLQLVDIGYASTPAVYASGVPVFENVLASLSVWPPP